MGRAAWGFVVIAVAIVLMLSQRLFGIESTWPFFLGLWVGVVGLSLINSASRDEERKRRRIIEQRLKEREERLAAKQQDDEEPRPSS
ncbi:MAG: hypothetical protein R6U70_10435 [Bacillota bacterium]